MLEEQEEDAGVGPASGPKRVGDVLGLAVGNLRGPCARRPAGAAGPAGVVIQAVLGADPGTDVLAEGDIVVEVNRQPTPDVAAYRKVVGSLKAGRAGLALRLPVAAEGLARLRS